MEDNLLFTNPDINLKTTANILNISERTLSQVINEHLHQNFSEYNKYIPHKICHETFIESQKQRNDHVIGTL